MPPIISNNNNNNNNNNNTSTNNYSSIMKNSNSSTSSNSGNVSWKFESVEFSHMCGLSGSLAIVPKKKFEKQVFYHPHNHSSSSSSSSSQTHSTNMFQVNPTHNINTSSYFGSFKLESSTSSQQEEKKMKQVKKKKKKRMKTNYQPTNTTTNNNSSSNPMINNPIQSIQINETKDQRDLDLRSESSDQNENKNYDHMFKLLYGSEYDTMTRIQKKRSSTPTRRLSIPVSELLLLNNR